MTKLCLSLVLTLVFTSALNGQQAVRGSDVSGDPAKGKEKKADKAAENLIQELKQASLDDLLAKALKGNPDIRVAESKVREMEAELTRMRMQVMQKVSTLYYEIRAAEATAKEAEARLARAEHLYKARNMPEEEYATYVLAAKKYRHDLAVKEAQLPYLVGKSHEKSVTAIAFSPEGKILASSSDNTVRLWDVTTGKLIQGLADYHVWDLGGAASLKGTMADKIRQALDTPVIAQFTDMPAQDVLVYFQNKVKGVNFLLSVKNPQVPATMTLSEAVPLGAALQCFEDTLGWKVIVRDYGLVVTETDRLPPGAMLLMHFWKSAPAKKPASSN